MATRGTEPVGTVGTGATYHAASAGGDKVTPTEGTFLHVVNGGASPTTVTIVTPGTVAGLAVADRETDPIAAGDDDFINLSDTRTYRNPADGLADITWSETTSVTFAVLRV